MTRPVDYDFLTLLEAVKLVCDYACDEYKLDCTNGITLRDAFRTALCGGHNNVAAYLLEHALEQVKRETK